MYDVDEKLNKSTEYTALISTNLYIFLIIQA